ncbi:hypothetical protein [Aquabacterium sp. OR-4]|uniref:hypothetical protein n=1 Tax=Aquabacterium sp. OR-4 TaxID=2978127 RepID=UPI0021B24B70|nr:hypothetical protein [Aquabacterium sp. OR-4]MDT7836454.1 hypothetical protein [Aquabacterium sp. OR-4]
MEQQALIAALRSARQSWVALPLPGNPEVRILRPAEAEFGRFAQGITVDHVAAAVDGWRGFTEATLLGAGIGAEDEVAFSTSVWAEWVRDQAECIQVVARAIGQAIESHLQARQAAAGN